MDKVRALAFESLIKCEKNKSFSNIETDQSIKKYNLEKSDKSFFTALVYGVLERKIELDYLIGILSDKKVEKLDVEVLTALRMGLYQLKYMDKVPEHAAVFESVELCKAKGKKSASSFVNAVLRGYTRQKSDIKYPDKEKNYSAFLSVKYSFPEWLCKMWTEDFGKEFCEKMLESLNVKPNITLRVNTLKSSVEEIGKELDGINVEWEKGKYTKDSIRLLSPYPISELEALKEGRVFVQDEASQMCAESLGAKCGERVVDTCSCPGGKSFSLAVNMQNKGEVFSFDLHENKLSLVKKGASLLGIDIIKTKKVDGTKPIEELYGCFDRVLIDAPCSGLGVIAKKPDLRYKEKESTERLPEIQYSILSSSCNYVKPGGILVYSTCTVNKRENEENVKRFLSEHTEFESVDFEFMSGLKSKNGMLTLTPFEHGTDGFFISKFKRKQNSDLRN